MEDDISLLRFKIFDVILIMQMGLLDFLKMSSCSLNYINPNLINIIVPTNNFIQCPKCLNKVFRKAAKYI